MRWSHKPHPKNYDMRTISCFLWLPKTLRLPSSGLLETRWFERCKIGQQYISSEYYDEDSWRDWFWANE